MIFGPARVRTNKSPGTAMGLRKVNQESLAVKPHLKLSGGSPERQEFKTRSDPGPAGSKRPVPEGVYDVAGGVPSAVPGVEGMFYGMGPDPLPRGDFGLHLDANRSSAPGTAGCIGFADNAAFSKFKAWMATGSPPRKIVVDWGLGSLQKSSFLSLLSWFERDEWTFDPSALARREVDTDTGELLN